MRREGIDQRTVVRSASKQRVTFVPCSQRSVGRVLGEAVARKLVFDPEPILLARAGR
jgi:hypothetical protein